MARTVLFFDPYSAGHRLHTVLAYTRRVEREPGLHIVFAIHEWIADQAAGVLHGRLPTNVTFVRLPVREATAPRHPLGSLNGVRLAERLAQRYGASLIYFMYLDTFLTGLALRLCAPCSVGFSGLLYKASPFDGARGSRGTKERLKAAIVRRLLRSSRVSVIHTFDVRSGNSPEDFPAAKLVTVPDGVSPPDQATAPADVPEAWLSSGVRMLLFGALSERKGIFQLLTALDELDDATLDQLGILVCGVFEDASQPSYLAMVEALRLKRPGAVVELLERFVPDDELWWLLRRSSLVLAPYQKHVGSSGVLRWAAAAGKPVLTQNIGAVGREVETWRLGTAVDTTRPSAIAEALRRFASGDRGAEGDPTRRQAFADLHSEEAFAGAVLSTLAAGLSVQDG